MRDIGWAPFCGNGRLDPDEACDSGANNSDTTPGACRSTCVAARCGDARHGSGGGNATTAPATATPCPGACRSTCVKARCGDGVADPGEACDNGASNSDTAPGACRSTCVAARCGDQVMDPGEACDDGTTNSDTMPGACRALCVKAACGDGVIDPGEACDDGGRTTPPAPPARRLASRRRPTRAAAARSAAAPPPGAGWRDCWRRCCSPVPGGGVSAPSAARLAGQRGEVAGEAGVRALDAERGSDRDDRVAAAGRHPEPDRLADDLEVERRRLRLIADRDRAGEDDQELGVRGVGGSGARR